MIKTIFQEKYFLFANIRKLNFYMHFFYVFKYEKTQKHVQQFINLVNILKKGINNEFKI